MVKLGMTLAPAFHARVVAKRAKMVEDAGIEYVWVGEEFNRELYTTLTTIALATEKVKLGLGGTNPYTRSLARARWAHAFSREHIYRVMG